MWKYSSVSFLGFTLFGVSCMRGGGGCYKLCFKKDDVHFVSYYITMDLPVLSLFVCGSLCITFCEVIGILASDFLIKRTPFYLVIIVLLKLLFIDDHFFTETRVLFFCVVGAGVGGGIKFWYVIQ